jgi:RNA recognition motif-containing protein
MKIFIGNLPDETTQDDLRQAFEPFGRVTSVTIVADTGESKSQGFGFVIMPSAQEAQNAIKEMHGTDFRGRKITVERGRTNAKARAKRRKRSGSAARGSAKKSRGSNSGGRRGKRRH